MLRLLSLMALAVTVTTATIPSAMAQAPAENVDQSEDAASMPANDDAGNADAGEASADDVSQNAVPADSSENVAATQEAQEGSMNTTPSLQDGNGGDNTVATRLDPEVRKLNTDLLNITKELDNQRRRHFYTIYNSNNLIATVKHIRGHVGDAITACSENNPDMKEKLTTRYQVWTEAVDKSLVSAEGQVENMILAQDYVTDDALRNVLTQADALRAKTQQGVENIPVTSQEACEYLFNKMDETQKNLVQLLEAVLVTMPQAIQQEDFGNSTAQ